MSAGYPPRILRPHEAHYYAGMGRTMFDREIRPYVPEIQLGGQGVGFDRLDLDRALDEYKTRNVRVKEQPSWPETSSQGCTGTRKQGKVLSTNVSTGSEEFATALQRARNQKQKRNITGQ
jgi:hypothetical protein